MSVRLHVKLIIESKQTNEKTNKKPKQSCGTKACTQKNHILSKLNEQIEHFFLLSSKPKKLLSKAKHFHMPMPPSESETRNEDLSPLWIIDIELKWRLLDHHNNQRTNWINLNNCHACACGLAIWFCGYSRCVWRLISHCAVTVLVDNIMR